MWTQGQNIGVWRERRGPCLFQPHGHISFILAERGDIIIFIYLLKKKDYSSVYYISNGSDLFFYVGRIDSALSKCEENSSQSCICILC